MQHVYLVADSTTGVQVCPDALRKTNQVNEEGRQSGGSLILF